MVVVVMVGVAVQVVAVDSQSTGHHHTLDRTAALFLADGRAAIVSVRFQLRSKQSAHLCHMLVVVHVAVPLVPAQLPLGGADGRRTRPVAGDGGDGRRG